MGGGGGACGNCCSQLVQVEDARVQKTFKQLPTVTNVCMQPLHLYCSRSAFHSSFVISCKYDGFHFRYKQFVNNSEVQLVMSL